MDSVKSYYLYEERYDWLKDPRRFEKVYHRLRRRLYIRELNKFLINGLVLDAGCGTGLITVVLPSTSVVALDINPWNLEKLRKRLKHASIIQADLEYLPFRNKCFCLITCTEVLEHLTSPETVVKEFNRVLEDDGVLVGTVPSINPIWRFRKFFLTTCPVNEPFHRNYTVNQLKKILDIFPQTKIKHFMLGLNLFFEARKTPSMFHIRDQSRSQGGQRQDVKHPVEKVFSNVFDG
ncbi:MAG: class I SAM-dependent methyltransferase [Candidatus Caldarchaeum sp.]|nr:class I SAM-dependent methyltransferase [Candidatus Caldarchaeum sp.]